MNKKIIHLGPLGLIIAGFFWSSHINPGSNTGYNIGFGIGMFLIPAIPGLIFAIIHRSFSKKKAIDNPDVLDGAEPIMKKKSFMFYFSLYSTLIGVLLFMAMMTSKE